MLTELEKKIIASLQDDMPVSSRPYKKMADRLGIEEALYLETLNGLCQRGVIRRFGATIRHQKSGFSSNAMVAWRIEEDRVEEAGEKMAAFAEVSHCYRRNPSPSWPYNLYTMVHAGSEADCEKTAEKMSRAASADDYQILFSRKELKKTSMIYFPDAVRPPEEI
ncbi:Lrp/AsnC family transcriptional regulator [Candidatus Desulfarcum epimagneticum]|uniref:siroheme decarboxylase n=1 Tax=uncultured Desulfobacteraceae bacterium TaxID=218296 RepID=A0A484HMH9_9BACT|nr:Lrp/AsnC family transcriptional regulator [uncultured Desulfobacteraceae bacterium]